MLERNSMIPTFWYLKSWRTSEQKKQGRLAPFLPFLKQLNMG